MSSLKDELAGALTNGFTCRVRYVRSQSKPWYPLFSPPAGHEPEKTRLTSHFLAVSINGDRIEMDRPTDTLVLGIEALVYSTRHLTTIFVSKADSTGYLRQQRPSISKLVIATFLRWLSNNERQRHPSRTLVISLFARAQSQYLFPGSAENPGKHVLDDRQLIKWWARVLDPIFPDESDENATSTSDGYITVPGYERSELRQFMPPNKSPEAPARWKPGNPLLELAQIRKVPADVPPRSLLPVFPDDPKARFMQDLDGEVGISDDTTTSSPSKRRSGKWKSIRDLDRFWEAMEFRQECSSGRMVGFLWLMMRPVESAKVHDATQNDSQDSIAVVQSELPSLRDNAKPVKDSAKRRRKPLSGPIIPRQPRLKGGSSSLTASSDLAEMLNADIQDGIVLSKDGYDKAMQTLLHLDFAQDTTAATSTNKWVSEVSGLAGLQADWSLHITGTARTEAPSGAAAKPSNGAVVNDLGGMVRKKRKNEDNAASQVNSQQADAPAVNVLSSNMVRKKPKVS